MPRNGSKMPNSESEKSIKCLDIKWVLKDEPRIRERELFSVENRGS